MPSNNLAKHNARRYKQQSRLTFEATEPSSSTGMLTPAKVRYEAPSSSRRVKGANFSFQVPSPRQLSDDADSFPSGKKFAVVVEASPGRTKISQPLFTDRQSHTPTGGKQTRRQFLTFFNYFPAISSLAGGTISTSSLMQDIDEDFTDCTT